MTSIATISLPLLLLTLGCQAADPRADDEQRWEIVEQFEEDTEAVQLRDAIPLGSGFVALTDGTVPLTVYSRSGRIVSRLGRVGRGPSEFRYPVSLSTEGQDGTFRVWDLGQSVIFTVRGSIITALRVSGLPRAPPVSVEYRQLWYGSPGSVVFLDSGLVLPRTTRPVTAPGDLSSFQSFRVDAEGRASRLDLIQSDVAGLPWSDRRDLAPVPLWAGCGSSGWIVYLPSDGSLTWYDSLGLIGSRREMGLPDQSPTMTDRLFSIRHQMARELGTLDDPRLDAAAQSAAEASAEEFSPVLPDYVAATCSADGAVWLRLFDGANPPSFGSDTWLEIDRKGANRWIRFPRSIRVLARGSQDVIGVLKDDRDVEHLVLLRAANN